MVSMQANDDRRHERAADRTDATNDDHHESEDEDILAHADLDREDWRLHDAGKACKRRAKPEDQRVEELDVDAERADHLAIGSAGADQHAEPGAHDQAVEQARHRERGDDDDQAIDRVIDAGNDLHRLEHLGRQRQRPAGGSPDQPHQFIEEQQQPERAEHVVEMTGFVEPPDRDDFQYHPGNEGADNRQNHGEDEASGQDGEGGGEISAEHVERTVRQVHEVHDAEHQGQPGGQQKQQHAQLQLR